MWRKIRVWTGRIVMALLVALFAVAFAQTLPIDFAMLVAVDMALYVDNGEYFRFDDKVKVVTMSGPDVQPNDCATRFDTARLPAGAQINVRNDDVTLCINTSFSEAQRQGIKWKIVVLHVTGVSADGTVNVSLKAWNVPE